MQLCSDGFSSEADAEMSSVHAVHDVESVEHVEWVDSDNIDDLLRLRLGFMNDTLRYRGRNENDLLDDVFMPLVPLQVPAEFSDNVFSDSILDTGFLKNAVAIW